MLIKSADDRSEDIRILTALLDDPNLTSTQKQRIRQQRDNLEKGAWGEQKAAYFIDFHFAGGKNNIILHDLRLVSSDGRVAQIDHVIINRMMFIYVLESKNWKQLTVDETGVCTIWAGRTIGVESPLEQCKRHAEVLSAIFESHPNLNALALRHEIISRVLVAPGCNLRAPFHKEGYLKADHFHAAWEREFDDASFLKGVLGLSRLVSPETLAKLGQELAGLHQPDRIDWRARFGLPPLPLEAELLPNRVVASIEGLSEYVPKWGEDWFILKAEPTDITKKIIKAAGYRAKQENGEWVWRLKS
jgi:hypothetical protein